MPGKLKKLLCDTSLVSIKRAQLYTRAVGVEGPGAEGTCNPVFSSSVNSILNRGWPWGGGRLCSPHYDVTPPGFSDLPKDLFSICHKHNHYKGCNSVYSDDFDGRTSAIYERHKCISWLARYFQTHTLIWSMINE